MNWNERDVTGAAAEYFDANLAHTETYKKFGYLGPELELANQRTSQAGSYLRYCINARIPMAPKQSREDFIKMCESIAAGSSQPQQQVTQLEGSD